MAAARDEQPQQEEASACIDAMRQLFGSLEAPSNRAAAVAGWGAGSGGGEARSLAGEASRRGSSVGASSGRARDVERRQAVPVAWPDAAASIVETPPPPQRRRRRRHRTGSSSAASSLSSAPSDHEDEELRRAEDVAREEVVRLQAELDRLQHATEAALTHCQ